VDKKGTAPKSLQLYTLLQALTLCGCWTWFAALWTIAFFNYSLAELEWWSLVGAACAGLYGLRPNLERAIDAAWLRGANGREALQERIAQLRPIKRRIDLTFSLGVLVLLVVIVILLVAGTIEIAPPDLRS
jgi:hypothetical protein